MATEINQPEADTTEVKPAFLQPEPGQISDLDLEDISGGAACHCSGSSYETANC